MQLISLVYWALLGVSLSQTTSSNNDQGKKLKVCKVGESQNSTPTPIQGARCDTKSNINECPFRDNVQMCCSKYGYCDVTEEFCHPKANCLKGCWTDNRALNYSYDGKCGTLANGLHCNPNNPNGSCCSKNGYCGKTDDYCHPDKCELDCK